MMANSIYQNDVLKRETKKKKFDGSPRIHVRRHCDYGKNGTFIILV